MDRRRFLQMCGGGLVATATMAEAGFFADFMAWLKRKPVWSIPSTVKPRIIGATAEWNSVSGLHQLAAIYYDRKTVEALKNNMPFRAISEPRSLPQEMRDKSISMLQFALNPAEID